MTYAVSPWSVAGSTDTCSLVTAHVTANAAGTVQYHWTTNSGATSAAQTLTFASAGTQDVSYPVVTAASPPGEQDLWAGLFVDAPNQQDFGHIAISPCTGP